jgi:hypothetical protein
MKSRRLIGGIGLFLAVLGGLGFLYFSEKAPAPKVAEAERSKVTPEGIGAPRGGFRKVAATVQEAPQADIRKILAGPEAREKAKTKLSADLHLLVARDQAEKKQKVTAIVSDAELLTASQSKLDSIQRDPQGRIGVRIRATDPKKLLPDLKKLDVARTVVVEKHKLLETFVPLPNLLKLDALAPRGLLSVTPIWMPILSAGVVTSQGVAAHSVDRVQAFRASNSGAGYKIGVISDSFNYHGGANADAISGDLPVSGSVHDVAVVNGDGFASGGFIPADEGRAMLQIIHDIAPGSQLYFSTALGGEATFAQNIRDLAAAGCKIIVDDVIYHAEPMFQDGIIAQAVNDVVTTNGVAYFGSAGNQADRAYEKTSVTTASDILLPGSYVIWQAGDTRKEITLQPGQRISLGFQWDDPFYTASGVDTDIDLVLVVKNTSSVVASAFENNITSQRPFESLEYTNNTGGQQIIELLARVTTGPAPGRIKYVHFGDNVTEEYLTNSGTVQGACSSANAMAVAAVAYYDQGRKEAFTAKGGVTILFDPNGNPVTPEPRAKPDIAAVDGVNTTFFGAADIEGDGYLNFSGTSAAAPHAAAMAAVIWNENPGFTPAQVYDAMRASADPSVGDPLFVGAGLVSAWKAVYAATEPLAVPKPLNYSTSLEEGYLNVEWETRSTGAGRIKVTGGNAPQTGAFHVTMDAAVEVGSNETALNTLTLSVDPSGLSNVTLRFNQREFSDSDDPMAGPTFTDGDSSDGVAFSINGGTTWFRLVSLTGSNSTNANQQHEYNISQIAASNGIFDLGSAVLIRFQQYGRKAINIGGMAFDDITVSGVPSTPGVSLLQTGNDTTVTEDGVTDTYQVFLNTIPSDPVTVTLTPDSQVDLGLGDGVPIQLTFAADSSARAPQTVTVRARDDVLDEGNHSGLITHSVASADTDYNGISVPSITVSIADNDKAPLSLTVTNTNDSGAGSLRQALLNANNAAESYTITIAPTLTGTITLGSPLPVLNKNIDLIGPGADKLTISGNNAHRVFEISAGTVRMQDLTIANGTAPIGGGIAITGPANLFLTRVTVRNNAAQNGAGIVNNAGGNLNVLDCIIRENVGQAAGGILNVNSTTVIRNSTIDKNQATQFSGGGIQTINGTLHIVNVFFDENTADDEGGGLFSNNTIIDITKSQFQQNQAISGGAIYQVTGDVVIDTTTFDANNASGGGGVNVRLGTMTLDTSLFYGNQAGGTGGGFRNENGTPILRNVTFVDNRALLGGGIYNQGGTLRISHATLTGNEGTNGGGGIQGGGDVYLQSSIVHGNTLTVGVGPDLAGLFKSARYNLVGSNSGFSFDTDATGNLIGTDPQLSALDDNGGPTQTCAIAAGSPAVNTGLPNAEGPTVTDQRGAIRVFGGRADIGAYEVLGAGATTVDTDSDVVNNDYSPGNVSLREAIAATAFDGDVTFSSAFFNNTTPRTITLSSMLRFDKGARLVGPGINALTISGNNSFRVIDVPGVEVTLKDLTVANGAVTGDGGAVEIRDQGTLTLDGAVVRNSSATGTGGAIMVNTGSTLNALRSVIRDNQANGDGGGVFNDGGAVLLELTEVSGNTTNGMGGGVASVLSASRLTTVNALIVGNTGATGAGGLLQSQGRMRILGTTFSGNTATAGNGGGVLNMGGGLAEISNATLVDNHADAGSGGGYYDGGGTSTFKNTLAGGNTSSTVRKDLDAGTGTLVGNASNFVALEAGAIGFNFSGTDKSLSSLGLSLLSQVVNPALANNGGLLRTHELVVQGPLVDTGNNALVASELETDQRGTGFPRLVNATVDIGAMESEQPEIAVLINATLDPETGHFNGTLIADNTGSHDLGKTAIGYPLTATFTIDNTHGTRKLNIGAAASASVPAGFSVTGWPNAGQPNEGEIPAGGWSQITLQLNAVSTGTPSGTFSFANNDSDENPYNFTVSGDVGTAEINVKNPDGDSLPSGTGPSNTYAFGATDAGVPVQRTFTIENVEGSGGALNIFGVTLPTGWFLVGQMPAQVLPGQTATFTLQFHALAAGSFSGTVQIQHNDDVTGSDGVADENPYEFVLTGTVNPVATYEVTSADASGFGSLRAALDGIASDGTITFNSSLSGATISPATELILDKNVTLDASALSKLIIDGGNSHRIFRVNSGVDATLIGLILRNGNAAQGAGLWNNGGTLTFRNGAIESSTASGLGGGLYSDGGSVKLYNTSITENDSTGGSGGGVAIGGGTLTTVNCTVSSNQAPAGAGGGLHVAATGIADVLHSTVVLNSAATAGGIQAVSGADVQLGYTILGGNTAGSGNADLVGAFTSSGFNILGTVSIPGSPGTDQNFASLGAIISDLIDPVLRPNGPRGRTHSLARGSTAEPNPALNVDPDFETIALPAYSAEIQEVLETDQDGAGRVISGAVDVGAKEFFGAEGQVPPPWGQGALDTNVSSNFNDDVDEETLDNTTFVVRGSYRGVYSAGEYSATGPTATFNPDQNFFPGELVTASLYPGITSGGGGSGSVFHWQFRIETTDAGTGVFKRDPDFPTIANATAWAAFADMNADGRLDFVSIRSIGRHSVYFRNAKSNHLSTNDFPFGNGNDLGGSGAKGAAIGDFNADGRQDILVVHGSNIGSVVYLQSPEGVFSDFNPDAPESDFQTAFTGGESRAVAVADLDGDGDLDAIVANYGQPNQVAVNDGAGNFTIARTFTRPLNLCVDVKLADVDGDGDFDAIIARDSNLTKQVYLNDGGGVFTFHSEFGAGLTSQIAVADVSGDTFPDVVVANRSSSSQVFINNGSGQFGSAVQTFPAANSTGVVLGDLNGDGWLDIAFSNTGGVKNQSWLKNTTTGQFELCQEFSVADYAQALNGEPNASGITAGDLDLDGDLDVVTFSASTFTFNTLWLNTEPVPPTATVTEASNLTSSGGTEHFIEIRYDDNVRVDYSNLNNLGVRVIGPDGYNRNIDVHDISTDWDAPSIIVRYKVLPTGDVWNYQDNGTYQVYVQEGQVPDTSINYVTFTGTPVGAFEVNIPDKAVSEVLTPDPSGAGTLVDAITQADPNGIIYFDSAQFTVPRTLVLSGEQVISKNLTITGPGASLLTIKAADGARAFRVASGVTLKIEGATIEGGNIGSAGGGAIRNEGTLKLIHSHVKGGSTTTEGGAIYNTGTMDLVSSALSGGSAGQRGGGVLNASGATARIINSTVAENTTNGDGGAIYNFGTLTVLQSTLAYNTADADANFNGQGGAIVNGSGGTASIRNSFVTDNLDNTPINEPISGNGDPQGGILRHNNISGSFTDGGFNFIQDASGSTSFTNNLNGNKVGFYPFELYSLVTEFKIWGGETPSILPVFGAAVVDAGPVGFDLAAHVPSEYASLMAWDQRGEFWKCGRVRLGKTDGAARIDIGATETDPRTVVTSLDDTGTVQGGIPLRGAIRNAQLYGGVVTFAPHHPDTNHRPVPLVGTYRMDMRQGIINGNIKGVIPITQSIQVIGPGKDKVTISSFEHAQNINAPYIRVTGPGSGPLIRVHFEGLRFELDGDDQAAFGIEASGANFSIRDCEFVGAADPESNNPVGVRGLYFKTDGFEEDRCFARVINCHFHDLNLGGFFDTAPLSARKATLRVHGCTFEDNDNLGSGGGITASDVSLYVENSTFARNEAQNGGAIGHFRSDFDLLSKPANPLVIRNSVFRNNEASNGAAIDCFQTSIHARDVLFEDNIASSRGGGINIGGNLGRLETYRVQFHGNRAANGGGIAMASGAMKIVGTEVLDSIVSSNGGGVYATGCEVELFNSAFSRNTVGGSGGGVYLSNSKATLAHATISLNVAGENGGGIFRTGGQPLQLTSSAVLRNQAGTLGGGVNASAFSATSTVIADNQGPDPEISGTMNSGGYNLIGDTAGATITGTTTGNVLNQTAPVGPLRNNGGAAVSHDPLFGNAGTDTGDPDFDGAALLPALSFPPIFTPEGMYTARGVSPLRETILLKDNREYARTVNSRTDIGPVEYFGVQTPLPEPIRGVSAVNGTISATFNDQIDPATVDSGSITVWGKQRGFYNLTPPSGAAFSVNNNIQLALDPVKNYFAGEEISVFVEPGVSFDPGGNPSSPYQWTFRAAVTTAGGGNYKAVPEVPSFGDGDYVSVALGDVDNDGDLDVVAAAAGSQPNAVFLNDATGNFTAAGTFAGGDATQILLADLNSDGFLDAVTSNHSGQAEEVFFGNGTGAFVKTSEFGGADTNSLALGDVDGDGDIDGINANNGAVALYANNGAGVLSEHEFNNFGSGNNRWIVLGDVDGDGDLDAVVTRAEGQNREVYLNDGNGHFLSHQTFGAGNSTAAALGDIDDDGDLDAVFANGGGAAEEIFLNDGDGNFTAPLVNGTFGGGDSTQIVLGDVDGDGDLDAVVANTDSTETTVYQNDGIGQFTEHPTASDFVEADTRSIALGDIDGDGDLDLVAANYGAPLAAWLNVEATPPTAALSSAPTLTTHGVDRYQFTVTYSDNVAVDVSTLGAGDIRVTGPNGFDRPASLIGVNLNTDGTPRVATYEVEGPGGTAWNLSDNGTYTVSLLADAMTDNSTNPAAAGDLGVFTVNLPPNAVTVVNSANSGTGSLRQAILDVAPGGDIYFSPSVFDNGTPVTITLTSGELDVNKDMIIHGPGADKLTISAGGVSRVFDVGAGVAAAISGVTLADGSVTGSGGAVQNAGTLDLIDVHVKDSEATVHGGGVASSGTIRIFRSTISGNAAGDDGGGAVQLGGTFTAVNSTFTENAAVNHGGGIMGAAGTLIVRHCTISGNMADSNLGGLGDGGAIRKEGAGTATVEHSILAGNVDLSPPQWVSTHPDISGPFVSGGWNLVGMSNGSTGFTNGTNNDQVGTVAAPVNALLLVLADNGGPVPTMKLQLNSPAVNAGNPAFDPEALAAPFDTYLATDNRGDGFPRIVNSRIDKGAFELEEPEIAVLRPDSSPIANGSGSYAFGTVEAGASQTATFTIQNTGTGELQLVEPIVLPSGVTLQSGLGATVLAAGQSTTFTVRLTTAAPSTVSGNIQVGSNDADEGTFTFAVTANVVDTTPPAASLTPLSTITTTTVSQLIIDVTFTDVVAVDASTIGSGDISVSGPVAGFPASPSAVAILDENDQPVAGNGTPRKARFTFNVPTASGKFGWRDNGTYTVNLVGGSVLDTAGNPVTGGSLGSFVVNVPRPFASWQQRHFADGSGGLLPNNGATDDPDNDGLPNVYEYFFGSNPNDVNSTPNFDGWYFQRDEFDGYDLKFGFTYPLYKDDVTVVFETSADLITWTPAQAGTDYTVEADHLINGLDAEYFPGQFVTVQKRDVRYQITTDRADNRRQAHFRLKLQLELP